MKKNKLRIAVLGTRGIPGVMGGVETHCQELYPRLVAKGHSVTLFARKGYVRTRLTCTKESESNLYGLCAQKVLRLSVTVLMACLKWLYFEKTTILYISTA